jgi:hypothetical protein
VKILLVSLNEVNEQLEHIRLNGILPNVANVQIILSVQVDLSLMSILDTGEGLPIPLKLLSVFLKKRVLADIMPPMNTQLNVLTDIQETYVLNAQSPALINMNKSITLNVRSAQTQ